ncbi:MAG: ABC transporter permease [Actinomycetota bacterium]
MNLRRIRGVYRRQFLELWHNPSELFEIFSWAILDLLAWGLLASFIQRGDIELPLPIAFLIGSALLWNVMFRVQIGASFGFLWEVWSGNALAVFASPVRPLEYFVASTAFGFTIAAVQLSVMSTVAAAGFGFGFGSLGAGLVPFFAVLIVFGLAMSFLVLGLILRFGHGANMLAWTLTGLMQPLSAVYYPLDILPAWLQKVSVLLPTTHAFEAMREVMATGGVPWDRVSVGFALDLVYLIIGIAYAARMLEVLKDRGYATRYAY